MQISALATISPAQMTAPAQSAYFACMCHEIRTPLTAILGVSQILLSPLCPPEKQGQCVEALRDSALMLKELIDDMLDNSRLEAGMMELEPAPFDFTRIVHEAIHIVTPKAEEKGLHLYAHVARIPTMLVGDAMRIRQIALNLLSNAVKFTDHGYIRLDAQAVADIDGGWSLRFAVTDTGIGIAPECQERIFDKYAQAELSTSRKYGGTGLGLTISRELARMMDGDIMVESAQGKGSRFTALLRLAGVEPVQQTIAA